jgi:hypothetical protein
MLVFLKNAQEIMYMFEVELLLKEKIGKDLKNIVFSFLRQDPEPFVWLTVPVPSPWDPLICVEAGDGIDLPLFAP